MTYITGDTHGSFDRIESFCRHMQTTKNDTLIILGDAGFNYNLVKYDLVSCNLLNRDILKKQQAAEFPITLFCIHGNHEARPQTIPSYVESEYCGGKVMYEKEFPNILFAIDGEVYHFEGQSCIVIGGAYSVDKFYRLVHGWNWWADEQPSDETKAKVKAALQTMGNTVDIVLSHTCPLKYEPTEVFISGIDQSEVDKSTEIWLDKIEESIDYKKWYCGHYHTEKRIERMQFMFEDFDVL